MPNTGPANDDRPTASAATHKLVHTGLRVPHTRLRVSAMRHLNTSRGIAFTAVLRLDDKRVGVIEDAGNGGGPLYRPDHPATFTYDDLNAFVAACRGRHDTTLPEEVLNDLVEEYETQRLVNRFTRTGGTAARLMSADGYTVARFGVRTVPTGERGRRALVRALTANQAPAEGQLWQLWDGQSWQNLPTA